MKKDYEIKDTTILCRKGEPIYSQIDKELVILSILRGEYYNLDSVASRIWNALKEPCTFISIKVILIEEYDVPLSICDIETKSFLEELIGKDLIEIINETS